MNKTGTIATGYAFLAAALYALNAPLSKALLQVVSPAMMAALLYLGAGLGIGLLYLVRFRKTEHQSRLTKQEMPFVLGMILDIAAPILLMLGLQRASAESAALLGNFEIVATSIIALALFSGEDFEETLDRGSP
ncbi:MAG: EamA family transporter [Eubacteriales bacterium]